MIFSYPTDVQILTDITDRIKLSVLSVKIRNSVGFKNMAPRELFEQRGMGERLRESEVLRLLEVMREKDDDLTEDEKKEANLVRSSKFGASVLEKVRERLEM